MFFKPAYKCQRCGKMYADVVIRDSGDDESFNEIQKHLCGPDEYGAAELVGINEIDEVTTWQSNGDGRFGRIARLIQRGLGDEAVSELSQMQQEEHENNRWLPVSDAPRDSRGNIIPRVYHGHTTVHCASGLIRRNGTEWEWITCYHRGIGDAGQPTMLCPISEAPDVPR